MDIATDLAKESSTSSVSALWLVRVTKAASIGAFVVQCSEFFNHIPEEIDYLWRMPVGLVTYLYAWSRYFPLVAQLVNLSLSEIIRANPKPNLCLISFTLKAITAQLMSTCVDAILMIRVHALYNCSRRTGLFLLVVMIIGTSMEVAGATLAISRLQPVPQGTICIPKHCSFETLLTWVVGCGVIQGTLLVMTVVRIMLHRKSGWMRTPVVSLMLRDGFVVFVMLATPVIVSIIITFEMLRNEGVLVWHVAFSWYIALLSIVGCRLVLNLRKLAIERPRNRESAYNLDSAQFSSVFEEDLYFSAPSSAASDSIQQT